MYPVPVRNKEKIHSVRGSYNSAAFLTLERALRKQKTRSSAKYGGISAHTLQNLV